MIRSAVLFLLSLSSFSTMGFAQTADNFPPRSALFAERFGGAPTGYPVPTHVKGALSPSFDGPSLRAEAIVSSDLVRIGDLIDNAGAAAEIPIFRSPDLGQTGSVPAARVIEAVRPHQIVGLTTRGISEVAVTRASRAIGLKDIEARILRALAGQHGLAEISNLAITFDNEVRTIHVEPSAGADLRVQRLNFEPRSGRFDIFFDMPGSAVSQRQALRYSGTVSETFEAVVPKRSLAAGETITASDLTVARRPKSEQPATAVIETAQAIGRASRRALRPGQVIRVADLVKAEVVQRNENITISYEVPGIMLTMRGQALEAGAVGDVINVLNVQSKKTIRATVAGPGHVTVAATSLRVANNAASNVTPQAR